MTTNQGEVPRIGQEEAKARFDQGSAIFVDVRSPSQYAQSHIQGAVSLPLNHVGQGAADLPRDRTIITY